MGIDVRQYVWDSGLSIEEVARRVGSDGAYVHRLLSGKLPLTVSMARKLETAMEGKLTAAQMLGFAPLPDHSPSSPAAA